MSALMDIWQAIHSVVTSADYYTLGAAVVIIVVAGFLMEGIGSIVQVTLVSLIAFALVKFAVALASGHHDVQALAADDWDAFKDLPMLVLLAYTLIFGVLISIVGTIRSMVR